MSGPPGIVDVVSDVPAAFSETVITSYAARSGPRFTLVLSGGPTARRCYERLAQSSPGRIDWSLVDIYMGDERCVAPDDPDANQRLVRESLIEPVGGVGSFHPMSCDEGPEAYEHLLTPVAAFDLVHLGLGPDGHTASLFPGSAALEAPPGRLVLRSVDPNDRNPHERMTLTLEALARALLAVFTVSGPSKHEAFAAISAGADLPGARVRARQVLWLVDREAAGQSGPDDG
ncbi:MAG TPA: 6-phosphogluconolactonase [Acidimicrobiales bacterium]|nr:6-phosphogluconolactonase [Acidimicrobiales bacterium]